MYYITWSPCYNVAQTYTLILTEHLIYTHTHTHTYTHTHTHSFLLPTPLSVLSTTQLHHHMFPPVSVWVCGFVCITFVTCKSCDLNHHFICVCESCYFENELHFIPMILFISMAPSEYVIVLYTFNMSWWCHRCRHLPSGWTLMVNNKNKTWNLSKGVVPSYTT